MNFESLSAIARIKVQFFNSLGGPDYDRSSATSEDVDLLQPIVTSVLKALANPEPGKSHHLLAPFNALLSPDKYLSKTFKTGTARRVYQAHHMKKLEEIGTRLRGRFSRTTMVVLIVDTSHPRWTAVSRADGMEHTILVERRLVKILAQRSPESRLFGFQCIYHEIGDLYRIWANTIQYFLYPAADTIHSILRTASSCL
jgi:hypothetical protein